MYIRFCGNGDLGFRPDGGSLLNSAKVSKTLLPHHLVPRLARHACVRPSWLMGRPRSKSKSKSKGKGKGKGKSGTHASIYVAESLPSRASSHTGSSADIKLMYTAKPVGAGLLAKRPAHPTSSSRAGPLPQWACGEHKTHEHPNPLCASLRAKRPAHSTFSSTEHRHREQALLPRSNANGYTHGPQALTPAWTPRQSARHTAAPYR